MFVSQWAAEVMGDGWVWWQSGPCSLQGQGRGCWWSLPVGVFADDLVVWLRCVGRAGGFAPGPSLEIVWSIWEAGHS